MSRRSSFAISARTRGAVVHVADDGAGADAGLCSAMRCATASRSALRAAEQDHFRARARKRDGRFRADAASRAGDERDAAVEAE